MDCVTFHVNGRETTLRDVSPTTTLLQYLRGPMRLPGTKEGCAEGDCGACTVVVLDGQAPGGPRWRAVNSCLLLVPLLHGKQIFTVEGLRDKPGDEGLHPVQRALVDALGSQCGYCTPGVVMSMVEACHRPDLDADWKLDDQMCGNLCRCTGYRPILEATRNVAGLSPSDRLSAARDETPKTQPALDYGTDSARGAQRFWIPTSWEALFGIISAHPGGPEKVRFIQGATDLGLDVTKHGTHFEALISLQGIEELRTLEVVGTRWSVGAGVKLADLEDATDDTLPPLSRMLRFFGSRQIKNSATVGGNVCNASPIGDLAPVFLALNATFIARGVTGERPIAADDFFTGYRTTALQRGELLARIEFDAPTTSSRFASYKVSKRREMDISAVAAALRVEVDEDDIITDARFVYGGMAATPARAHSAEAAAIGSPFVEATFEACAAAMTSDFTPMSDHRGSAWYRSTVAANLMRGFYLEVCGTPMPRLSDRPSGTVLGGSPS
ncbi:MAG: xanthine dehydrogenase small subunit [Nannocystales bacterium]